MHLLQNDNRNPVVSTQLFGNSRNPRPNPRVAGIAALSLIFILFFKADGYGQSRVVGEGLLIAPTKLEMGGRKRSETLTVKNQAAERTTYRLKMVAPLDSDQGGDASEWVRFSPRRISLNPGESQVVRVLVRKPADLEPGDYTARLLIQAIPTAAPKAQTQETQKGLEIQLTIVYGVTVPILIDHQL